MYTSWCVEIFLTAFLVFGAFINCTKQRVIYVTPENSDSQISCPVDHCYRLQDILYRNPSYSYYSHTTLELLSGTHSITEKVGQFVLIDVENFTLRGLSSSVNITCQPGATFGLTIIKSQNIEISNLQISHCSAESQLKEGNSTILTGYNTQIKQYLEYNLSSCDTNANSHPACYTFLTSFKNKNVTIYETAILYSRGVGIFSLDSRVISISKILLAYNQINCINFMRLDTTSTNFSMSQSQIKFGQTENYSYEFASGLNLFVHLTQEIHNIHLTDITFENNRGTPNGNFYVAVSTISTSLDLEDIDVTILITNITSIQTRIASPGMVIKYIVNLMNTTKRVRSNLLYPPTWSLENLPDSHIFRCSRFSSLYDPNCYSWLPGRVRDYTISQSKSVNITMQNSHFIGSCMTITDSDLSIEYSWFRFEVDNITISESRCQTALSIVNSDTYNYVRLSDLTIVNSHNNILLVNIDSYSSKLILSGNTSFLSNQGSVSLSNGAIKFEGFVLISNNTAHKYESVFQISDSSCLYLVGEILFVHNTGRQGGAISAYSSYLHFEGNVSFIANSADNGGAISLKEGAVINLKEDSHIIFTGNYAETYGGAIFIEDAGLWARRRANCFLHITNEHGNCNVQFENNTAGIAGAALFGGWIDICGTNNDIKPSSILDFKAAENSIASNPSRVCICKNSTLNKHESELHIEIFPGQTFETEVVAVGQRFGVVPASVRAETGINVIDQLQRIQDTENHCTKLKFTVRSSNRNETMLLSIDGQIMPKWINETIPDELHQFKVCITLKDCPLGFQFDDRRNSCSCHHNLDAYGVLCIFTTYKLNRHAQQWIGILNSTKSIAIYQHCPYDYCKPYGLSLNLSTPDEQCSSNRSGILCGACQPGLSHVLGTSNCKKCSNLWLLLITVFALAGVFLVAGLVILDVTVSTGTINGLIVYANIVRANTATFFPDKTANTFLSWFIAWLNLDVGIEMCFYDGLDAYMKTWLQFAFPSYIWFLVIVIIISSKYSRRAVSLFGVNAVPVLATLFLLSYAKLLRLTITVFQPIQLIDGHKAWHYDGNIAYLGKKHILLMLVALFFFVIFFIPYTLILFGIQWLQIFSHYKLFHWVNKCKPLFDAYTGPYKDKHRYWTGLLLLVRIGLFIVFSTNTSGDPAINLLANIIVVLCLFAYLAVIGGVYKNWLLNLLEYSSLLNLAILSVAILYTTLANKLNYATTQVSVSITLCTTMLVIAYHGLVIILKALKIDPKFNAKAIWRSKKMDRDLEPTKTTSSMQQSYVTSNSHITHSVIELKEPLLEY